MQPNTCHYSTALPADWDPFYYLKIGKELTDWEGLIDSGTRLSTWTNSAVNTRVGKTRPTKSTDPDVNFSKYGKVHFRETSKHCNWAGTECWRIRVHPKIDSISAAEGY